MKWNILDTTVAIKVVYSFHNTLPCQNKKEIKFIYLICIFNELDVICLE